MPDFQATVQLQHIPLLFLFPVLAPNGEPQNKDVRFSGPVLLLLVCHFVSSDTNVSQILKLQLIWFVVIEKIGWLWN